ncbi:MAG: hypothetical protein HY906_20180 [Deltaproteobacteria bacterium]|nr:hypothetical protein [Deltaproteobacteria bacterium]
MRSTGPANVLREFARAHGGSLADALHLAWLLDDVALRMVLPPVAGTDIRLAQRAYTLHVAFYEMGLGRDADGEKLTYSLLVVPAQSLEAPTTQDHEWLVRLCRRQPLVRAGMVREEDWLSVAEPWAVDVRSGHHAECFFGIGMNLNARSVEKLAAGVPQFVERARYKRRKRGTPFVTSALLRRYSREELKLLDEDNK